MTRSQIVTEARRWIGTPFHHQGRLRGVGVDCVGLILGVRAVFGLRDLDKPSYIAYGRRPPRGVGMLAELDAACGERLSGGWLDGDILVFWMNERTRRAQHCGIAAGKGIIHAVGDSGVCRVVEHGLVGSWLDRLICAYRMPGVV